MILNLTQHDSTPEQIALGVFESTNKDYVRMLLTFNELPTKEEIKNNAKELAQYAKSHYVVSAMIGGAPFLMSALEKELKKLDIQPLYAFSKRESIEVIENDGVKKISVFKHAGWIEA